MKHYHSCTQTNMHAAKSKIAKKKNPNRLRWKAWEWKCGTTVGIECKVKQWSSEIFDCVTRSSDLEFKRAPAFGSYVLLSLFLLLLPLFVSHYSLWEQMSLFPYFHFFFFKLSFTKTPQWKRWFLLYSSFIWNLLYFLSLQSGERKRECVCGVVQTKKRKEKHYHLQFVKMQ